jgi:hypothetical protein
MIFAVISKLQKLVRKLATLTTQQDTGYFGDGRLGNVFYGKTDDIVPDDFETVCLNATGEHYIPLRNAAQYENLYISAGSVLKSYGDYTVILVNDTLYLPGRISCDNTHANGVGGETASTGTFIFNPDATRSNNIPMSPAALSMFCKDNIIHRQPFIFTGGVYNTQLYAGGDVTMPTTGAGNSGGNIFLYYSTLLNTTNSEIPNIYFDVTGSTATYGLDTMDRAGGCLIIAARKIQIYSTTKFTATGGLTSGNTVTAGNVIQTIVPTR